LEKIAKYAIIYDEREPEENHGMALDCPVEPAME
jgi:hypothetical protein